MFGKTELNDNSEVINAVISTGQAGSQSIDIKWEFVFDAFDMMIFLIVLGAQFIASAVFLILMMI